MGRVRRTLLIAALVALATSSIACSSDDDGARRGGLGEPVAASITDPCAMLDAAEVDAVTGWAVGAATPASRSEPTPVRLCHFTDVDHRGTVQVVVADDVGDAPYVAARQALAANPTVGDAVVPGASAAFQAPFDGFVGMVVDGRFVEVTVAGVGLDQADHIELATIVAERA